MEEAEETAACVVSEGVDVTTRGRSCSSLAFDPSALKEFLLNNSYINKNYKLT